MDQFRNFTLKIAVIANDSTVKRHHNYCHNVHKSDRGLFAILCEIIKLFHIKAQFVETQSGSYGICNATACDGVLELLRTNQAHIASESVTVTVDRLPHYSRVSSGMNWPTYLVYANKLSESMKGEAKFKQPFNEITLISIFTLWLLFWMVNCASEWVHQKHQNQKRRLNLFETFWTTFAQLLGQNSTQNIALLFCFTQTFIWYYAGCRGQVLQPVKPFQAFSNIHELSLMIQSKKVRILEGFEGHHKILFQDSHPEFVKLLSRKEFTPIVYTRIREDINFICRNPNFVAIRPAFVKQYPSCDITYFLASHPTNMETFGFSKSNFPFKNILMNLFGSWNEYMLIEKSIFGKMYKNLENMQSLKNLHGIPRAHHPVHFSSLKDGVMSMICLYVVACFCFIIEILANLRTCKTCKHF